MKVTRAPIKKYLTVIFLFFIVSSKTFSKTDINSKMEQLKQNSENSQKNLDQYQANLEIVKGNIKEIDSAMNQLNDQKENIKITEKDMDKNKVELEKNKKIYKEYIDNEKKEMALEDLKILDLKKVLSSLEANQQKRRGHIEVYEGKISEIEQEQAEWDQQKVSVKELEKMILQKEIEAKNEKANWIKKEKSYQEEVKKWSGQAKNSKSTYNKYKGLRD